MGVGISVVITDKDGAKAVELDAQGNLPIYLAASGDKVLGGVFIQPGTLSAPIGTIINRNAEYSSAQTGTVIWTPSTGKRIYLYGAFLSGQTTGTIKLNMGATIIIPSIIIGTAPRSDTIQGGGMPIWEAPSGDARIEVTSTIAATHSVLCWGTEV